MGMVVWIWAELHPIEISESRFPWITRTGQRTRGILARFWSWNAVHVCQEWEGLGEPEGG